MEKIITMTYNFLVRVPIEVEVRIEYDGDEIDEVEILEHRTDNIDHFSVDQLQESLHVNKNEYLDFLDEVKMIFENE